MTDSVVSTTFLRIRELQRELEAAQAKVSSQFGDGGGTFDGMSERLAKLEIRADGVERRLDSIDGKLDRLDAAVRDIAISIARLPSKEFLVTSVLATVGIALALAIAIAAMTFNIADYASKNAQQAEQAKAAQPTPATQPIVITLPQPTQPADQPIPSNIQPAPAPSQTAPKQP